MSNRANRSMKMSFIIVLGVRSPYGVAANKKEDICPPFDVPDHKSDQYLL